MKNIFRKIIFVLLVAPVFVSAQKEPSGSSSFDSRIFTGGYFGLQFGTYTLVELSPIVGYKVTDKFTPGISITYIYEKFKDPYNYYPTYTTSIYGGSVFMRYYVIPTLFAHVECQVLNLDVPDYINGYYDSYHRANVTGIFIGGGYREPIGERSSFNILLLYDINQDPFSPYQNPIIKVGLGIGI